MQIVANFSRPTAQLPYAMACDALTSIRPVQGLAGPRIGRSAQLTRATAARRHRSNVPQQLRTRISPSFRCATPAYDGQVRLGRDATGVDRNERRECEARHVRRAVSQTERPSCADYPSERPAPLLFQAFSQPISADCDVIGQTPGRALNRSSSQCGARRPRQLAPP